MEFLMTAVAGATPKEVHLKIGQCTEGMKLKTKFQGANYISSIMSSLTNLTLQ